MAAASSARPRPRAGQGFWRSQETRGQGRGKAKDGVGLGRRDSRICRARAGQSDGASDVGRGQSPRRSGGSPVPGPARPDAGGIAGNRSGAARPAVDRGRGGRRRPTAAGDRAPSDIVDCPSHSSRRVKSCRRSQCSRNISRALASRHRTVASRRPTIAATSADEKPSKSRSTKIVRYGIGIRSRMNWTS